MLHNYKKALQFTLTEEGGYNDYHWDEITNLGVTIDTWQDWVKRPVTKEEMKKLTPEMVAPLYQQRYWNKAQCSELPDGLDICTFDCAVNSGVYRAVILLQRCVNVLADGLIGQQTLNAIQSKRLPSLIEQYLDARLQFLKGLSKWAQAGKGWSNRLRRLKAFVL